MLSFNLPQAPKLSNQDYHKFRNLIYNTCGITLNDDKKSFISYRIGKLLRQKNIPSFYDFYQLVSNDKTGNELTTLLDAVSTNETFFFREISHFDFLREVMLPQLIKLKAKDQNKTLKIWSAGCSSGEEPYSLAVIVREVLNQYPDWHFQITATDISTKVLKKAKLGVYHKDEVKKVPGQYRIKYFQQGKGEWRDFVKIKQELRDKINFQRFNLLEKVYPQTAFDIIFCRNVMIYFNTITRQNIIGKFEQRLSKHAYLAIGLSESLISIEHQLKYIKPAIYKKE